jgi:hypothetical protein
MGHDVGSPGSAEIKGVLIVVRALCWRLFSTPLPYVAQQYGADELHLTGFSRRVQIYPA